MDTEEIVLAVAVATFISVLLWRRSKNQASIADVPNARDTVGQSNTPMNSDILSGPNYTVYNAPYRFGPPVMNFLPNVAVDPAMPSDSGDNNSAGPAETSSCDICSGVMH